MTTRELREMLFQVENQDLTVRELREMLFHVEEQDTELTRKVLFQVENGGTVRYLRS